MNTSLLRKKKSEGEKITCLTAYDASFARIFELAGVDMLMVGDSLGMVVQGQSSTLPVCLDHISYHCQNVRRGISPNMFVIADMPFMTYSEPQKALDSAARLMQEGQANMVKLEGAGHVVACIEKITAHGIPVCAHLGLTPQSVNKLGGYRVQGKNKHSAHALLNDALTLQDTGADMLVLECVPIQLAKQISEKLAIPVIGIGAGPYCDGQVLVSYDMLGITTTHLPRFVKNFAKGTDSIQAAAELFVTEVKSGKFPAPEHCYE